MSREGSYIGNEHLQDASPHSESCSLADPLVPNTFEDVYVYNEVASVLFPVNAALKQQVVSIPDPLVSSSGYSTVLPSVEACAGDERLICEEISLLSAVGQESSDQGHEVTRPSHETCSSFTKDAIASTVEHPGCNTLEDTCPYGDPAWLSNH